jgi:aminopeptidase N
MGLYASNGMLCTQCEAEGFRRITFFPTARCARLSRAEGDKAAFPVLLSNGNCLASENAAMARIGPSGIDPWPSRPIFSRWWRAIWWRPGQLHDHVGARGGLNIWTRAGMKRARTAMRSLINSMRWDEEVRARV